MDIELKDRVNEIIDLFNLPSGLMTFERRQCALIAVNKVLDEIEIIHFRTLEGKIEDRDDFLGERYKIWVEVKKEIERL